MELGIRGKRALVTGGSSGIGFAIAKELAAEGAQVILASRDEAKLKKAQSEIKGSEYVVVDMGSENSIREAWGSVGQADIILLNGGGPATGLPTGISLENWDKGYQTLIRSVLLLTQLATPGMQKNNWGRLLCLTSTSAREVIPRLPVSSTFRAGLTALTKELARELGKYNILVNNLLPGPVNTERLKHLATDSPAFFEAMAKETARGRIAEPEEIAKVAAFLLSNANTFVTGTDILADGGYTKAL